MNKKDAAKVWLTLIALTACLSFAWFLIGRSEGRQQLARQIALESHRIESTTNDFGTMEWRIVEIDQHPGDGEGDE